VSAAVVSGAIVNGIDLGLLIPLLARARTGDPLAAQIAGRLGFPCDDRPSLVERRIALRSAMLDDRVREALSRRPDLVVDLGVGLCTRRSRLGTKIHWIHTDRAAVLEIRRALLPPQLVGECLPLDFCELRATTLPPARRALVVAEACLMKPKGLDPMRLLEGLATFAEEVLAIVEVVAGTPLERALRPFARASHDPCIRLRTRSAQPVRDAGIRLLEIVVPRDRVRASSASRGPSTRAPAVARAVGPSSSSARGP
jgi:hypothetical protein